MGWWLGLGKDFKFNLRLNPKNEDHMEVARILETLHKRGAKTQMVVDCILLCCGKRPANVAVPPLIQQVIRDEVQKVMSGQNVPVHEPPQKSVALPAQLAQKPAPRADDAEKNLLLKSMQDFGL